MIPDEPVRGRTPPPWFRALSGVERSRALSRRQVPSSPFARLVGLRTTHVAPGTVHMTMPATEALLNSNGYLDIAPLAVAVLEAACESALPAAMIIEPRKFSFDPFRPPFPRPGNLVARARVTNSGKAFVFAEAQFEDPDARHLGLGTMLAAIRAVSSPPPDPPGEIAHAEEPVYETPDPYLRAFPSASVVTGLDLRGEGMNIAKRFADGTLSLPCIELFGLRVEACEEGRASVSMPASDWFCSDGDHVSAAAIATLAGQSCYTAMLTSFKRPDQPVILLDSVSRFLRRVAADGRRVRAESMLTEHAPDLLVIETKVLDADHGPVAVHTGSAERIDARIRERSKRTESRRVLTTLLFTDIVDSTGHAERLGDTRWRSLLEEHKLAVRRELSRYNGTEIDTAGDGFFVRFDSPAQAIEAARAAVRATARLDIKIRAGIHAGECELKGNRLAGMAVHIAARVQAAAQPGEVLVSSTVKDLAVGSGLRFADRGEQNLKGVPDPWRLYAVVD
jgi:class 3 adenylate cyclase